METIEYKLKDWDRNVNGEIVFKGTEDAIFYATLIYKNSGLINEIRKLRKEYLVNIEAYKKVENIDFDWFMILACQGQFYRECLEEVERLKHSIYLIDEGI